jgi:hypothetical protein
VADPESVVTVTSTPPAAWAGATTVSDVAELTVTLDGGTTVAPNATLVAPATKSLPVIDTTVPPATGA